MDLDSFCWDAVNVYTWQKFFQINNTFQELTNSGNLAIISNDSIKNGLLNLETLYKKLKYEEEHFRYDTEIMMYEPSYREQDINANIVSYTYKMSGGKAGKLGRFPKASFDATLADLTQKNGFAMATYELSFMNGQLENMKAMCEQLIGFIEKEAGRG